MVQEKYGHMLYNTCYGGYGISEQAHEELKSRMTEEDYKSFKHHESRRTNRCHPKVIELYKQRGWKWMSDGFSKLSIFIYPVKYRDYIDIHEYDGRESCSIDFVQAHKDLIENFLKRHDANPELTVVDLKKEIAELDADKKAYSVFYADFKKESSNTSDS